ncbi:MAG: CPBP family intramembrane glutamic endopeptidase [Chthonomonadales bacterium]
MSFILDPCNRRADGLLRGMWAGVRTGAVLFLLCGCQPSLADDRQVQQWWGEYQQCFDVWLRPDAFRLRALASRMKGEMVLATNPRADRVEAAAIVAAAGTELREWPDAERAVNTVTQLMRSAQASPSEQARWEQWANYRLFAIRAEQGDWAGGTYYLVRADWPRYVHSLLPMTAICVAWALLWLLSTPGTRDQRKRILQLVLLSCVPACLALTYDGFPLVLSAIIYGNAGASAAFRHSDLVVRSAAMPMWSLAMLAIAAFFSRTLPNPGRETPGCPSLQSESEPRAFSPRNALWRAILAVSLIVFMTEAFAADLPGAIRKLFSWAFVLQPSHGLPLIGNGLMIPPGEEVLFRGVIYARLSELYSDWFAILFSASLFAASHSVSSQFRWLFWLGVLQAVLFKITRSVYPCIAAHGLGAIINTAAQISG